MQTTEKPRVLSATTIIGDSVRNPEGDDLGKIEDLMLDLEFGRIAYAVLSFGGFLGVGNKLFAVPWDSLTIHPEEHSFVLDADKEKMKNAPGFDKDHWPAMSRDWGAQIYDYYGYSPYWND